LDFGGGTLTNAGSTDIYMVKFDAAGNHQWSQRLGDGQSDHTPRVATDSSGNVVLAGRLEGTVDYGGGPLTSAGSFDVFLAKFDASGGHLWSKRFGGVSSDDVGSVAVDGSDNIIITGNTQGEINLGGSTLTSGTGTRNGYVAKFDASGNHQWSVGANATDSVYSNSVDVDANGNVVIAGFFYASMDFGGGTITSAGSADVFVTKFDSAGNHQWSSRFGDAAGHQGVEAVAIDGSGDIILSGIFWDTVDFDGGVLTSTGERDVFVAKLDGTGSHLWSQSFGSAGIQAAPGESLAVDAYDSVYVAGYFIGDIDFGGGTLTSNDTDTFAVKFSSAGAHLWSQRFGEADDQKPYGLAVNADSLVLTGAMAGSADFGAGTVTSAGGKDIFMMRLAP
jgi:hypothetical protein